MKRFSGGFAFVLAFILGFGYFVSTFRYQQKRSTASFKNNYDLSCLSGEDLKKAIANRIVTGFKGVRKDGYMGLSVGHFTYSDSEEDKKIMCADRTISSTFTLITKKMACEMYPKVRLEFLADGESSNGEKREMDVETPCSVSTDLSRTEVSWVPWKQLALETPFEGVSEYSKPSKVTVKTRNISDKWPTKWLLNKIQLEGDDGQVTVDSTQIREVAGKPIIIEFN
jgi:hypothetical protein